MITVDNILDAQNTPNAIHIVCRSDGKYDVYVDGDELLASPQQQNSCPAVVTPRQIRLALTAAGMRTAVENAVKAGSQDLTDWWEYSLEIERGHPMIAAMCAQLGISDAQADAVFTAAAAL